MLSIKYVAFKKFKNNNNNNNTDDDDDDDDDDNNDDSDNDNNWNLKGFPLRMIWRISA